MASSIAAGLVDGLGETGGALGLEVAGGADAAAEGLAEEGWAAVQATDVTTMRARPIHASPRWRELDV